MAKALLFYSPLLIAFLLLASPKGACDGSTVKERRVPPPPRQTGDGSLDKRLPPILPGQEVPSGDGGTLKIWTTAGPVPAVSPPDAAPACNQPGCAPNGMLPGNVAVIVDRRSDAAAPPPPPPPYGRR